MMLMLMYAYQTNDPLVAGVSIIKEIARHETLAVLPVMQGNKLCDACEHEQNVQGPPGLVIPESQAA